tara:strand:+ start:1299 stop:1481 length:183 start_codon:yes stop_codon:yes gene_type:complete
MTTHVECNDCKVHKPNDQITKNVYGELICDDCYPAFEEESVFSPSYLNRIGSFVSRSDNE